MNTSVFNIKEGEGARRKHRQPGEPLQGAGAQRPPSKAASTLGPSPCATHVRGPSGTKPRLGPRGVHS